MRLRAVAVAGLLIVGGVVANAAPSYAAPLDPPWSVWSSHISRAECEAAAEAGRAAGEITRYVCLQPSNASYWNLYVYGG